MRVRSLLVASAAACLATISPASATHPYYLWMGIIEISSTPNPNVVNYAFSGFGPTVDWSGGCMFTQPWTAAGGTTTVSCTPPPAPLSDPTHGATNYCGVVSVTVSSTAPVNVRTSVSGTSACEQGAMAASASTPAPGFNASGNVYLRNLMASFPWTCTANAQNGAFSHPWVVRCTVSH